MDTEQVKNCVSECSNLITVEITEVGLIVTLPDRVWDLVDRWMRGAFLW
jgi:hypothetical protein